MSVTPDQIVADRIGREVDFYLLALQGERLQLQAAAARILEIDAEIAVLQAEKARIDGRRPPKSSISIGTAGP